MKRDCDLQESRTKKVTRNTVFSILYKISDVIFAFALRTVFIYTLGKSYLGISGLFTNILTVLSMMELGVGGAIVFSLYQPLAEKNHGKVLTLMRLYKKVYTLIGFAVMAIGFLLTPFLNRIINLPDSIDYIYIIYWLSIANTAISYFLAYRRSLLIADQRSDIDYRNQIVFRFTRFVVLSVSLLVFKNYILYLLLDVLNTLCSNIRITFLVKKRYAHVDRTDPIPLNKEEKQNIIKYMGSGIFSKFGQTVVNSTDNILISAFIGTIFVGMYSNYLMVTSTLDIAFYLLFSGLTASVGNFALQSSREKSENLFKRITFINYVASAYLSVCLISLINPFVQLWAGSDYLLSPVTVAAIVLNFYLATMQKSIECFMGAKGEMFYINRFRSLIEGVVNLAVSLILVKYTSLGITGVFLGTTACFVVGRVWMDAHTLYKYWFCMSFAKYFGRYLFELAITIGLSLAGLGITGLLFARCGITLITWLIAGIILSALVLSVLFIIYHKTDEFKFVIGMIEKRLSKLKR